MLFIYICVYVSCKLCIYMYCFSQSEHSIGPGSHVEYPTGTKNRNFVEDHPRNIPAKFGSNWPSCVGEEAWNVKSLDDGQRTPSDGNSSSGPGELKKINWQLLPLLFNSLAQLSMIGRISE
jgi:hypothetical protein